MKTEEWQSIKTAFIEAMETIPNPKTAGKKQIEYQTLMKDGYEFLEKVKTFVSRPSAISESEPDK